MTNNTESSSRNSPRDTKENHTELKDTAAKWPALTIDYERYDQMLADSDASEDEKREFLDVLWLVVAGFVDLGFEIHPLQQALQHKGDDAPCEQKMDLSSAVNSHVIDSTKHIFENQVSHPAARPCDDHAERKES